MDLASLIKKARENDEALSSSKNKNKNARNKKRKHQDILTNEDAEAEQQNESVIPKVECKLSNNHLILLYNVCIILL